jgi:hypothetical protein
VPSTPVSCPFRNSPSASASGSARNVVLFRQDLQGFRHADLIDDLPERHSVDPFLKISPFFLGKDHQGLGAADLIDDLPERHFVHSLPRDLSVFLIHSPTLAVRCSSPSDASLRNKTHSRTSKSRRRSSGSSATDAAPRRRISLTRASRTSGQRRRSGRPASVVKLVGTRGPLRQLRDTRGCDWSRPLKCPHCRRYERLEDCRCFRIASVSQNRRTTDLVLVPCGRLPGRRETPGYPPKRARNSGAVRTPHRIGDVIPMRREPAVA